MDPMFNHLKVLAGLFTITLCRPCMAEGAPATRPSATPATRAGAADLDASLEGELRAQCYEVLVSALADASPWVRVHAAEALVTMKRPGPALTAFRPEAGSSEPQYRIVVWRVLAAAEPDAAQRRKFIARIRKAFLDTHGPDQTHALEALAKLREPIADDAERLCVRAIADGAGPASPFAIWRLAQSADAMAVERLLTLLQANDVTTRFRAAYVLGQLQPLAPTAANALRVALETEPLDSPVRPALRAALSADAARDLARDAHVPPSGRYFAVMRIAEAGTALDYPLIKDLLDDANADLRVAAAYAAL